MQKQNVRVIVASEHPQVRAFLTDVVEEEEGAVIVGQAQNATKALALAKSLRPDAAIVDCYLPYAVGIDTIPLSRISGLDTAQTISEEVPNTQVILLCNLDRQLMPQYTLDRDAVRFFSREGTGLDTAFKLRELDHEALPSQAPIFANIEVKPRVAPRQKIDAITDKAMLFGGLGIFAGWFLIITWVSSVAGVVLALAGVTTLFLGLTGKLTASLWRKASAGRKARDDKTGDEKLK